MTPEEKIQYVKDRIDGDTLISPKGPIRYRVMSVGHPDNPDEWTILNKNDQRKILHKLEQEGYIKGLTQIENGDVYVLEKVGGFSTDKVDVDFTQKGKTSTDYLMEAVTFFKNEYNKIRIKGLTYEYPLGDNLSLSNHEPAPDEINTSYYRRIAIERLHEVGLVTSYKVEERVIDDIGSVFDYAHCKINEDVLIEPDESPRVSQENVEKVVEKVIRHEHDHKHRFENSIQEKQVDVVVRAEKTKDTTKARCPYKIPAGTRWEHITLFFVNDEYLKVSVAGKVFDVGFADMGFADGRSDKPTMQWHLLRLLASKNGTLPASDPDAKDRYKQHKKRLADALKTYFGLDSDPFKPYAKEKAYTLKMTIGYQEQAKSPEETEELSDEVEAMFDQYTPQ